MTQTIEQLTARVRELEESIESHAPEGRNYTNQQVVEMRQRFLDKLAASQLYAEQLRDAIEQYLAENDPSEFGCACDLSVGHLCGPCFAHKQQTVLRKALAIPHDTSALDAYVAEKVKEVTEKLHYRMEHCYSIDGMKAILDLDGMTRQRDLAVEALENCRLLAARHRKEEWAGHIMRFCKDAGLSGSPIRNDSIKESENNKAS